MSYRLADLREKLMKISGLIDPALASEANKLVSNIELELQFQTGVYVPGIWKIMLREEVDKDKIMKIGQEISKNLKRAMQMIDEIRRNLRK